MKHISPHQVTADSPARVPTRRAIAKQQTRQKVLAAARRLFSEQGYEGATIRDIAAAAGMSTGAVFANFTDKADLFREIMVEDTQAILAAMRDAGQRGRDLEDATVKVFMVGYAFYKSRLQLARAAFSVSWDREGGPMLRSLMASRAVESLFADLLADAIERGELVKDAEVKLRSEMLYDAYISNFPQAVFEGRSLDALQTRASDQVRILLAGARRG
jgi:AcrR family transcriptional regulator